ncbi:MAG: sigma-70 family RNA polymerase sigma factor [Bdellovibrio sp.]|nr:sigma-70 family RNA polymerase sigma factor [Bdellovibrio sp.]
MGNSIDPQLLEAIQRNKNFIRRLCSLSEFVRERSKELLQEVMLNLVQSNASFRGKKIESTDAWVKRVAMNTAATWRRDEANEIKTEDIELHTNTISTPCQGENYTEMCLMIRYMLREFSARECLIMKMHIIGETHQEIGEVVGMTPASVANMVVELKKRINEYGNRGLHE